MFGLNLICVNYVNLTLLIFAYLKIINVLSEITDSTDVYVKALLTEVYVVLICACSPFLFRKMPF